MKQYSQEEISKIIKNIPFTPHRLIFTYVYRSGLRLTELKSITQESIKDGHALIKPLKHGADRFISIESEHLWLFPVKCSIRRIQILSKRYFGITPHQLRAHHMIHSLEKDQTKLHHRLGLSRARSDPQ